MKKLLIISLITFACNDDCYKCTMTTIVPDPEHPSGEPTITSKSHTYCGDDVKQHEIDSTFTGGLIKTYTKCK